jgi:hypothetical protein
VITNTGYAQPDLKAKMIINYSLHAFSLDSGRKWFRLGKVFLLSWEGTNLKSLETTAFIT